MKPIEISNAIRQLTNVMEAEGKYCDENAKPKFSSKVAIAIAENRKKLEDKLMTIIQIEERNKKIAEKRGVPIEKLEEQRELMNTDMEIDINYIKKKDLEKCDGLSTMDFYCILFMTNSEEGEKIC